MFFPIIGGCVLGWIALSTWRSNREDKEIYWGPKLSAFLFYAVLAGVSWRIGEALAYDIAAEAFKALYTWTGSPPPSMVIGLLFPLVILAVKRYRHGRLVDRPSDSLSDDASFHVSIGPADWASVFGVGSDVSH